MFALSLRASTCYTIADGDFEEPGIWNCDCYPLLCDTLVIGHDVSIEASLTIQPTCLHILQEGSLTTAGSVIFTGTELVLNDGVFIADRVLLYPCRKFENNGSLFASDLHIDGDTLLNTGTITLIDSLLGWPDSRVVNHGDLAGGRLFGFANHFNYGSESFESAYCFVHNNYGSVVVDNTFRVVTILENWEGATIHADSLVVDNLEDRSAITCRSFVHGYGTSTISSQIFSGCSLITDDFYNGPTGNLLGGGDICISSHSENHGNLAFPLGVCDATPTMTAPPYLDINTGTFGMWVGDCENTICGTLGVEDHRTRPSVLINPNPNNGCFAIAAEDEVERIDVLDINGRIMEWYLSEGTGDFHISSDLASGIYTLRLRTRAGSIGIGRLMIEK